MKTEGAFVSTRKKNLHYLTFSTDIKILEQQTKLPQVMKLTCLSINPACEM